MNARSGVKDNNPMAVLSLLLPRSRFLVDLPFPGLALPKTSSLSGVCHYHTHRISTSAADSTGISPIGGSDSAGISGVKSL